MQWDGNLVIYDKNGNALWNSRTNNKPNSKLFITDEGKLCVYYADEDIYYFSDENADKFISKGNISLFYAPVAAASEKNDIILEREPENENADSTSEKTFYMYSPNSKYYAVFQNDGNLVVYRNIKNNRFHDTAVWHAGTYGKDADVCKMQHDGNLVIYDKNGNAVWNSQSFGNNNSTLYLSDNGELCIYSAEKGRYTFSSQAIATVTNCDIELVPDRYYYSPNHEYYAVFSSKTGNLEVHDKNDKVRWKFNTDEKSGKKCRLQTDGNLVLYESDGTTAVNDTKTCGMGKSTLYVTDTGKLCIYSNDKKRYSYIGNPKLSIPDEDIQITQRYNDSSNSDKYIINCSRTLSKNKNNNYTTGYTNLYQDDGLMMRRVDISTTIKAENISEEDIRENFCFTYQYRFNLVDGNVNKLRTDSDYLFIEKTDTDTYKLTEKNIPCLGDEVDFGIITDLDLDPNKELELQFNSADDDYKVYDVICKNGENYHITMKYIFSNEDDTQTWLRTMSRFINSLSDITGIKRNEVYIIDGSETLFSENCTCPCKDEYIIPSENGIPAVLVPRDKGWINTSIDIEKSISYNPNSIHLLYLHEVSHFYAKNDSVFQDLFNGNVDDGNTNIRGITAMQNCEELKNTILFAENEIFKSGNLETYQVAARYLADGKYSETVNFRILNMYANYIETYGDKGWAILEKYLEGGDPFFNKNLFSRNVERIIKKELENSDRVDETKCDDLSAESIKFMNAMQFFQQNAPDNDPFNQRKAMHNFINNIVNKNSKVSTADFSFERDYRNTFVDYFERIEKHNRGLDWKTQKYLMSTDEHID